MSNGTNWQRPEDEDGRPDVWVGDVWDWWSSENSYSVVAVNGEYVWTKGRLTLHHNGLARLVSRNGIPWDVPEGKRKGRWVHTIDCDNKEIGRAMYPSGKVEYGLVWLPDAEPEKPTSPVAGERWEDERFVYMPILDQPHGKLYAYESPVDGHKRELHTASNSHLFVGYYYDEYQRGIRSAPVLYVETPPRGNPHVCGRWKEQSRIVRPTHVVFMKEIG